MNSVIIKQHFAFAHGRIGVLQLLLLQQSDVDRLLGSRDAADAQKILTELKFTKLIDQSLQEGEMILSALFQWVQDEIFDLVPPYKRPTFNILWIEDEAAHLSLSLKHHHGLAKGAMEDIPITNTYALDFIETMKNLRNPTAASIDTQVARFVATLQIRFARTSGSKPILNYVRHVIDLHNIRTALRLMSDTHPTADDVLLSGGTMEKNELRGDLKTIRSAIDRSPIAFALIKEHLDLMEDPGSLERDLAKVTASDIAHMWNIPLGIEPVFAFGALALSHIRLIRVLLMGKRNNLRPQEIKRLLPPFIPPLHYVIV